MDEEEWDAYAYAVAKCGYVVTETNRSTFTPDELEAWDDALTEWETLHGPTSEEDVDGD